MADLRKKESKKLIERVRDRHKVMSEADSDNRRDAMDDIRFVNIRGAQWDENMKANRGDRPCYEYNKTKIRTKRVVNDIRDNRPSAKVRAVEGGDTETAEIYEGLIRNILNISHSDNATDYAAEYQVEGGMGAWRVNTQFSDDDAFDQDIVIEGIENPFNLYHDPSAKDWMKRDAEDWIYTERISHKEYEAKYGNAPKVDFEGGDTLDDEDEWLDDETVRVAEYWFKTPVTKELWLFQAPDPADPSLMKTIVVDSTTDEAAALRKTGQKPDRTRTVKTNKIQMVVASGKEILEGPVDWAGRIFPFIMVYGEYKVIDGKKVWWGLVRNAKDAQQNYNISKTAIAESIHGAPKAFSWMTIKQAEGLEDINAEAHKKNYPVKYYNPDREAPGPPSRIGGADVPIALMQQSAIDDADLKDVMGVPDESVGQETNASSGRAIFARQQQGQIANFNFKDNHAKGHELMYEILIDLIPEIYDTERELRVLGSDGRENYMRVNQVVFDPETGKSIRINDLSAGKYDVTVKTGPAFATLRQEATEMYSALGQQFPQIWEVAGDLIMQSMDLPYADDISDRLKSILPPQIQQSMNQGKEVPPEVAQMMQQAQMAMEQVQQHGQLVQEAAQELEAEKALNAKEKAEIGTALAQMKTASAEFDAKVANELLRIIEKETGLTVKAAELKTKGAELKEAAAALSVRSLSENSDAALTATEVKEFTENLDDNLSTFIDNISAILQDMQGNAVTLQNRVNRKPVGGATRREGGRLVADVEFDDGSTESIAAIREQGNLRIVRTDNADPDTAA